MRQERKEKRQAEIENAAYEILENKGFEGASMAMLAKQANASMETLYRWYGDKNGLFSALVLRNAKEVLAILDQAEAAAASPHKKLQTTSAALLTMLTGAKAIALNRAAVSDKTGTLGQLLSQSGRALVGPRLATLLIGWRDSGAVAFDNPKEAAVLFVNLLVGDHQIKRVTGVAPPLTPGEVAHRVTQAMVMFQKIHPPLPP